MSNEPIQMAIDALDKSYPYYEGSTPSPEYEAHHKATLALRQHQQNGGWLPIESAPKDGTRVLITDGKYVYQAHYTDDCEFGQFENDHRAGWQIWACEDGYYSSAIEIDEVVKWMPLPPPAPKKENDDANR